MTREQYLRELDSAGCELRERGGVLWAAANPVNQLRAGVVRDWKWWLPGASAAGFALARFARRGPAGTKAKAQAAPASGAALWLPIVVKLLPALFTQLTPLFLSLRSGRKQ
ncbi:MAG: hypothetical protein WCI38_11645 [Chthoniobacterales bacterium]|jgi:hypothetical protein